MLHHARCHAQRPMSRIWLLRFAFFHSPSLPIPAFRFPSWLCFYWSCSAAVPRELSCMSNSPSVDPKHSGQVIPSPPINHGVSMCGGVHPIQEGVLWWLSQSQSNFSPSTVDACIRPRNNQCTVIYLVYSMTTNHQADQEPPIASSRQSVANVVSITNIHTTSYSRVEAVGACRSTARPLEPPLRDAPSHQQNKTCGGHASFPQAF
jgi:hypothetical protein